MCHFEFLSLISKPLEATLDPYTLVHSVMLQKCQFCKRPKKLRPKSKLSVRGVHLWTGPRSPPTFPLNFCHKTKPLFLPWPCSWLDRGSAPSFSLFLILPLLYNEGITRKTTAELFVWETIKVGGVKASLRVVLLLFFATYTCILSPTPRHFCRMNWRDT